MRSAWAAGMDAQWKKLTRPTLVGFLLGLVVMAGIAYVTPSAARPPAAAR